MLYITEVYYDENGRPNAWIEPEILFDKGLFAEDFSDIKMMLKGMKYALGKPVLEIRNNKLYERGFEI